MKIYIKTFGCKVNSFESAAMAELLYERGFEAADSELAADAVIVNSCTVTANGDKKTRQYLRRVKRENPSCAVMLSGCFAQAFPERAASIPEADVVCGTGNRAAAVELLCEFLQNRERAVEIVPNKEKTFEPLAASEPDGHTRAFLKIEDGCERYCSYCIVPYARGPVRSLALDELKARVENLANNGFAEIVLSGINLSCYGRGEGCDLAHAVSAAASVEGIERIRLGSLEPDLLSDDMLDRLAAETKLCPHFHLALQSGCDATLRRMNRHYTAEEYTAVAERIRARFERATFTTDLIVGFPGETESDFEESLAFAESFGFLKIHVFPYSLRDGTAAAKLPDHIEKPEKERRAALMGLAAERSRERVMRSFIGKTARVILEQPQEVGGFGGYTDRYLPALVLGKNLKERETVTGIIEDIADDACVIKLV